MNIVRVVFATFLLATVGDAQSPTVRFAQRLPMQKKQTTFKSPSGYAKRLLGVDAKTGQENYYDHKPQIKVMNAKAGLYSLNWIGYDGKIKTIAYQRPDAIDVIVSASVSKLSSGKYLYSYSVKNLISSGEYLKLFALQTFSSDLSPLKTNQTYIGSISPNNIMKEGAWLGFGIISEVELLANPGRTVEFRLESSSPPGLVECRVAGGNQGMKGVGEEMPEELESLLPRYEAWPNGYTIAPTDKLRSASQQEKFVYLRQVFPTLKQQGWITSQTSLSYEHMLNKNDLQGLLNRAANDFKVGSITSELLAFIELLKN
jgi:hypothetical protein